MPEKRKLALSDLLSRARAALAGRYRIDRQLGRGGMGTVFLAQDLRHQRSVAVKVLHPDLAGSLGPDRFLREVQIAASLTHPHIVPLHDSGAAGGLLYYVMPYVEGESLRERLTRETQMAVPDAVAIALEVSDALAYAHGRGVVHRDVKPENILLEGGHAVVTDFGIASAVSLAAGEPLTEPGLAIGTPAYMSPEQAAGGPGLDGRSDMYALACVLYEMLAGAPPFSGPTPQAVIARHLADQPPSLRVVRPSVPVALEEVIEKALAKVPADRFVSLSQFASAVGAARSSAPALRHRNRVLWAAGGAAGLLIALSGYLLMREASGEARSAPAAAAPSPASIAVLYFEDRTEGGKLGYLADGLTEDLIDRLASVRQLRVISPDGVRQFRGSEASADSIARTFQVGTIVTGSVSGSGDRLRVSVRLTDAGSGVQLFSDSFEKPFGDLLVLRDQMTDEVARQLRIRLGEAVQLGERRAGTRIGRAWDLVLQAERIRGRTEELLIDHWAIARSLFDEADSLLVEAERLDPRWTEPIVLRGWLAFDQAGWAMGTTNMVDSARASAAFANIANGLDHAARALRIAPGNPEALGLRGTLRYRAWHLAGLGGARGTTQQLEEAERDLRRAAAVPQRLQAQAWSTLSGVLQFSGKMVEANLAAQRAYEADAYLRDASAIVFRLFATSFELKRYPEAAEWCDRGRRDFPSDWTFLMCQLTILAWTPGARPDVQRGWALLAALDTVATPDLVPWLKPQLLMMVATVLAADGLRDSAERTIARARQAGLNDPDLPYYEALARVRLRQPALAAERLRELLSRSPNLVASLRTQSRFGELWSQPALRAFR